MAKCTECIHHFVCETLKGKTEDTWAENCFAYRHKESCVEVVRCKDCIFSAQHDPYDPMECVKWATKWGVCYTTPDGYCHKGERKNENP